jgi:hypothetical protein
LGASVTVFNLEIKSTRILGVSLHIKKLTLHAAGSGVTVDIDDFGTVGPKKYIKIVVVKSIEKGDFTCN